MRYVGDPFVDTGIAVLEHRIQKPCGEFSDNDLLAEGDRLAGTYSQKQWKGILTFHFPNSGWTNPNMGDAKVAEFREKVLRGFRLPADPERRCEYCGRSAQIVVDGSVIPLASGAGSMDCGAGGQPGFAVCGYCLFALQFYPLASLKVEGKALFWWSHDRDWLFLLSGIAIRHVGKFLAASPSGDVKARFPGSRLLTVAREAFEVWYCERDRIPLRDIVGCHSSNYRTAPEFDEMRIPRELLQFWQEAASGFSSLYDALVSSAWQNTARAKSKRAKKDDDNEWNRRNAFYESLGAAFRAEDFRSDALAIARKYFLQINENLQQHGRFGLACLFLERMAGMTKIRIDAIRQIADQIASSSEGKRILDRLIKGKGPIDAFLYAQIRMSRAGEPPLSLDKVLCALDLLSEDDSPSKEAWLVRDLIVLRIIEQMGQTALNELPEFPLESITTEGAN